MKIETLLAKWSGTEIGKNGTQQICEKILAHHKKSDNNISYRRSNSGFVQGFRVGAKGWADFDIIMCGKYIALECKGLSKGVPTRLSDSQTITLEDLRLSGAQIWIVHDPVQLKMALESPDYGQKLTNNSLATLAYEVECSKNTRPAAPSVRKKSDSRWILAPNR